MAYYAITYTYAVPELQQEHRPAHREYLSAQVEAGALVVSGPLMEGEVALGALLIVQGESIEAAQKLVRHDPMYTGGAVLSYTVQQWNPVIGTIR